MLLTEKNDIIKWLDKYKVENYTLKPDEKYGYVVDVAGHVYLGNKNLKEICVKFGNVTGNFYCGSNQLISLEDSPCYVGRDFSCSNNQLISLEGAPHTVGSHFFCNDNQLVSLQGIPDSIGESFFCHNNPDLGELQDITDFKAIQAYLLAKKLSEQLSCELNIKENKSKVKL